ncbi:MAG TPA: ABC transporter permease [Terriglobales bacterium]|nr:ABC transporter permease [Terriglobales bacterium]
MFENIRFALRNPGFAALAIVTLALGIGANTAMFTVIDSVLLRALPYRDADRIVSITPGAGETTSWPNYSDIRQQARQLEAVAGYIPDFVVTRTSDGSQGTLIVRATASLFDMLGVRPAIGRALVASDNEPGAANVVVLTAPFWHEHFGGDTHAVGQQIKLGDDPYTIVGILPEGFTFHGTEATKGAWTAYRPSPDSVKERGSNFIYLIARIKRNVCPTLLRGTRSPRTTTRSWRKGQRNDQAVHHRWGHRRRRANQTGTTAAA